MFSKLSLWRPHDETIAWPDRWPFVGSRNVPIAANPVVGLFFLFVITHRQKLEALVGWSKVAGLGGVIRIRSFVKVAAAIPR
jgi:hypothetical protein